MNKATISLGQGCLESGFPSIAMQLWNESGQSIVKQQGSLIPNPQLAELYRQWRSLYLAYCRDSPQLRIEIIEEEHPLNFSRQEFDRLCQELEDCLNLWLNDPSFFNIRWRLGINLHPKEEVQIVIETQTPLARNIPWHLWNFLQDYPLAEIALSLPAYEQVSSIENRASSKIKVLGAIGSPLENEFETDKAIIKQIPQIEAEFLDRPTAAELKQKIRQQDWDIFFFAGHSYSEAETGTIVNQETNAIELSAIEPAFKYSIARGLKLAIFNSCDGLGLAWNLAKLNIPQTIVMSQPIADRVAQEFLQHFLAAIAQGKSTYLAVRQARENLKDLEDEYPCASWLPTICQNPAASALNWQDLPLIRQQKQDFPKNSLKNTAIAIVAVTAFTIITRSLGWWQGIELKTYDWLMRMQTKSVVDDRLLLVTIDEADIQYQDRQGLDRRGSVGDAALLQALTKLESYHPQAIALDLYHDFPFEPQLANKIADIDLIAACEVAQSNINPYSIAPPPGIPIERVGFTDFPLDPDSLVRRQFLFMDSTVTCPTDTSFALQVALNYLNKTSDVSLEFSDRGEAKIGDVVFPRLSHNSGGYQLPKEEALGYQVLFNYPAIEFSHISLRDLLEEGADAQLADLVRDKIVLIGAGTTSKDSHVVSHSKSIANQKIPGVDIHARTISRIINAVETKTPLLWWWTQQQEYLWIATWSVVGGTIVLYSRSRYRLIILLLSGISIETGITIFLFLQCGWIPFLPGAFALFSTSAVAWIIKGRSPSY